MLIVRPLKYSPKTNININHQPRTKHKKKRLKVTIKSSPFFVCLTWWGCKTGKIRPNQDVKYQISRNIKRQSGFGGNGIGILLWYSIQKAGLLNVVLFILDVILQGAFFGIRITIIEKEKIAPIHIKSSFLVNKPIRQE